MVAAQLSNFTCENCVSYNMLKLTRLLHFHQPHRVDMLDYYERTLFNQMLGEQDPASPHGFNCYYTGLSSGAFKRQPLNYFPQGNPGVYATDWDTFTCDTATGLETQAKFADTIYSRDADGLYVNLFIPSQVRSQGLVLEQATGFPDDPVIRLSVVAGAATLTLRVRVPKWVAGSPTVRLNGALLRGLPGAGPSGWIALRRRWRTGDLLEVTLPMELAVEPTPDHPAVQALIYGPVVLSGKLLDSLPGAGPSSWIALRRRWQTGDLLEVTLPMQLAVEPTPDHPAVQALIYGPVVLSGVYGSDPGSLTPQLEMASIHRTAAQPMTFEGVADRKPVKLIPIARAAHEYYTTYCQMV